MQGLGAQAFVRVASDPVEQRPARGDLGRAVGEHELDALILEDGTAELDAVQGEVGRQPQAALGSAQAARRDHQPLLHEPFLGQVHALAKAAQDLAGRHVHILERELRMLEDEGVHIARDALDAHARRILVDKEQREEPGSAVGDARQHDQEVGDVADGDVPFLAVDDIAVTSRDGRGLDGRRVGAGTGFGHGEGVAPPPLATRSQVFLALLRRAVHQHVGRTPDDIP